MAESLTFGKAFLAVPQFCFMATPGRGTLERFKTFVAIAIVEKLGSIHPYQTRSGNGNGK
jgi:hypothetical protein